jgi:outer membrane protein OmpA-like peptidoglycan-associated protein
MNNPKTVVASAIMLLFISPLWAQQTERVRPRWFFGQSIGINANRIQGNAQDLNALTFIPTAFTAGTGIKPYASVYVEYFPKKTVGIMLNLSYDHRGGKFTEVLAPCDCPENLTSHLAYASIEPSLKFTPFKNGFYVFAGPTFLLNINKGFTYTQLYQTDVHADFGQVVDPQFGGQAGLGFDWALSNKSNRTQIYLSPFASIQTNLVPTTRVNETWNVQTIRVGLALKIGGVKKVDILKEAPLPIESKPIKMADIPFSVRAPEWITQVQHIQEVLPLRHSIFFDMGSAEIPARYTVLNAKEALKFTEAQMVQNAPDNLGDGRSARQMAIYHHILNITGDRLRSNPQSSILLIGSSDNNAPEGKRMAALVKAYLVNNFQIDSSRISLQGREHPLIPSEQKGGVRELDLLHQGDRRVDIITKSSRVLEPVGNRKNRNLVATDLKNTPKDLIENQVVFTAEHANKELQGWNMTLKNEAGVVQQYGPYTRDVVALSGNKILGQSTEGTYAVQMIGTRKDGGVFEKSSTLRLKKALNGPHDQAYRFSVLFEFDQAKSIVTYKEFLTQIVGPYLTDKSRVSIHGHTDIIGDEAYNLKLSKDRAQSAQKILENYLKSYPNRKVTFETVGYGEEQAFAPFENTLPEERFYNRCVIIDVVSPQKP